MGTFLTVVGGVIVGGLLLIVLAFLALKLFLWNLKRQLKGSLGELASAFEGFKDLGAAEPIDLEPIDSSRLLPAVVGQAVELEKLGFARAGDYEVEAAATVMTLLADESRQCWAAVSQSEVAGVTVDVCSHHADGRWITHMTTKDLGLTPPPGFVKTRMPQASVPELVDRHLADRPDGDYQPATVENVVRSIKDATREELLARAVRGGLSDDELDANLKATDTDADGQQSALTLAMMRGQAQATLEAAFTEKLQDETTLSVAEWERVEDDVLIVHALSDNAELARHLHPEASDAEEEKLAKDLGDGESKIANFAAANAALSERDRLRHLADLTLTAGPHQIPAAAYVGRDWDEA